MLRDPLEMLFKTGVLRSNENRWVSSAAPSGRFLFEFFTNIRLFFILLCTVSKPVRACYSINAAPDTPKLVSQSIFHAATNAIALALLHKPANSK